MLKNKAPKRLFFLALVPDEPGQSEMMQFKYDAARLFNSRKSLNSPAHITLIPPFFATENEVGELISGLAESISGTEPFEIRVNGFDRFGKRVIFLNVESNDKLDTLQQRLYDSFAGRYKGKIKPNRFHAHITVAFRDLEPAVFPKAWEYFSQKEYEYSFTPEAITVLKHADKKWHFFDKINLKQTDNE